MTRISWNHRSRACFDALANLLPGEVAVEHFDVAAMPCDHHTHSFNGVLCGTVGKRTAVIGSRYKYRCLVCGASWRADYF